MSDVSIRLAGQQDRPVIENLIQLYLYDMADVFQFPVGPDWRRRLVTFLSGVDTLIHDAMYAEQIAPARCGWGHSTPRQSVTLAMEAECRRLILFHHEPEHDDEALDRLLDDTRAFAARTAPGLEVEAASEGMEFPL